MDYALAVRPKQCFPVHDGGLKVYGSHHGVPAAVLPQSGIQFVVSEPGKEITL